MLFISSPPQQELFLKILVVGDAGVGKTSFIRRYVDQEFTSAYRSTVGVDFAMTVLKWGDKSIRLQLWDIAGQERYTSMTRVYYKDAAAALVVFDVSHPPSLRNVKKWKEDIEEKVTLPDGRPIPCILVANKCDLSNDTFKEEHEMNKCCEDTGFRIWSATSAKTGKNVHESVGLLIDAIISNIPKLAATKEDSPESPSGSGYQTARDKVVGIQLEQTGRRKHGKQGNNIDNKAAKQCCF